MPIEIPSGQSLFSKTGGGDPLTGGNLTRIKKPNSDTWKQFGVDFSIIYPVDRLYFYIQHEFFLRGKWHYIYCLGTPNNLVNGEIVPTVEGSKKCASIILPGTEIPLHNVTDFMDENDARTRIYYRFGIVNWSSSAIQLADFTFEGPNSPMRLMMNAWQEDMRITQSQALDVTKITWRWTCEASGRAYRHVIRPIPYSNQWKTREDIQNYVANTPGAMDQFKKMKEWFTPRSTEEAIREELGATVKGNIGSLSGEDIFGDEAPQASTMPAPLVPPSEREAFTQAAAEEPSPEMAVDLGFLEPLEGGSSAL